MTNSASIPVVDISPLYSDNSADWHDIDQSIGQALEKSGAFMADGIPKPVRPDPEQTKALLAFYNLSFEERCEVGTKVVNPNSPRAYRGYTARRQDDWIRNEIYDIGPAYDVTGPAIPRVEELIEPNAWPPVEPAAGWRVEMERYYDHMHDFSKRLMRAIIRYLGANDEVGATRFGQSNSTLRLLNYPPLPKGLAIDDNPELVREFEGETLRIMAIEHQDQCCLTLLWQSDVGGLQMQSPAGEWQAIPAVADGVSVHLGMAMETMSDYTFAGTPHRVLGKQTARQSIGFFLEPNLTGSIRPFVNASSEAPAAAEDTYAASLLATIRGREERQKIKEAE